MNARQFLNFFKSKTGQVTAFGLLIFVALCLLAGVLYFRHGSAITTARVATNPDQSADKSQQPASWFSHTSDAGYANKHPAGPENAPVLPTGVPSTPVLPISLYHGNDQETEVSDTYAPYGRMIPCETVITIDSAKIETPIIGFVTEDVWHDGKLIIPAGAEVHGRAQVDPSRERIASENNWILVWRTSDRMNGAELPLHGVALDMERNETTGTWQLACIRANPQVRRVFDVLLFQFAGGSMIDVVPNVLFVGQDLVDCPSGPRTLEISQNSAVIQKLGDFNFALPVLHEGFVHPADNLDLFFWTRYENDPVSLDALVLTHFQQPLLLARMINEHATEAVTGCPALLESQLN